MYTLLAFVSALLMSVPSLDGTLPDSTRSHDDVSISFTRQGNGPTALIFVHGWTLDGTFWDHQIEHLSNSRHADRYSLVAVDLGGHGRSGRGRTDCTMEAFGADVAAVAEAVGAAEVILIGHSMGGAVIVEAARLLRERVDGFVFVDAFHDPDQPMAQEEIDGIVNAYRADFRTNVDSMVRSYLFVEETDPSIVDEISSHMSSFSPEIGISAIEYLFNWDASAGLASISAPAAAVNASRYPTNQAVMERLNIDVRLIDGVGHFPMVERPDVFNEHLSSILETWR